MSESNNSSRRRAGHGGFGGPGFNGQMPVEKPKNFKKTFHRLMSYLKPHTFPLIKYCIR